MCTQQQEGAGQGQITHVSIMHVDKTGGNGKGLFHYGKRRDPHNLLSQRTVSFLAAGGRVFLKQRPLLPWLLPLALPTGHPQRQSQLQSLEFYVTGWPVRNIDSFGERRQVKGVTNKSAKYSSERERESNHLIL